MNFSGYIENLRKRPAREREKMAVIATGVSFAMIFVIWLVSFGEMNRSAQPPENIPADESSGQLENLKNSVGGNEASIEEMLQLPDQGAAGTTDQNAGADTGEQDQNVTPDTSDAPDQQQDNSQDNQQGSQPAIPQLP